MKMQLGRVSTKWRSIAVGLLLAALLATPLVVVATMANPPPRGASVVGTIADPSGSPPSLNHSGDVGSFAHGYLEFDVDPAAGVAGFDSWPPGSYR